MKLKTILLDVDRRDGGFLFPIIETSKIDISEDNEGNFKIFIVLLNIEIFGTKKSKEFKKMIEIIESVDYKLLYQFIFQIVNEHLNFFEIFEEIKENSIELGKDLKSFEIRKVLNIK